MNNTYHFELTNQQKKLGFTYLIIHSVFFLNLAADFLLIH